MSKEFDTIMKQLVGKQITVYLIGQMQPIILELVGYESDFLRCSRQGQAVIILLDKIAMIEPR